MTDATRLQAFRARCEESAHRIQRQAGRCTIGSETVELARARIDRMVDAHESYQAGRPVERRKFISITIEQLKEVREWL